MVVHVLDDDDVEEERRRRRRRKRKTNKNTYIVFFTMHLLNSDLHVTTEIEHCILIGRISVGVSPWTKEEFGVGVERQRA